MFPACFEYHRAISVKEALGLIQQYGDEARLLSGGHSLLPILKLRLAQPRHLVDIARIAGAQPNCRGGWQDKYRRRSTPPSGRNLRTAAR